MLLVIIVVGIAYIFRHCGTCLKPSISETQAVATCSSRRQSLEYDEVSADPLNTSTEFMSAHANTPVMRPKNNDESLGGADHSGYESIEMEPQSQPYESLANPSQSQNYENMITNDHEYESLAKT